MSWIRQIALVLLISQSKDNPKAEKWRRPRALDNAENLVSDLSSK